jgi:hypothetical protein
MLERCAYKSFLRRDAKASGFKEREHQASCFF